MINATIAIQTAFLLLIAAISYVAFGGGEATLMLSVFFVGGALLFVFSGNSLMLRKQIISLYTSAFIVGLIYLILCYSYMSYHQYEYLLAADAGLYFLPKSQELIANENIYEAFQSLWNEYSILERGHEGYFIFLLPFLFLGKYLSSDPYIALQLSSLVVYAVNLTLIMQLFRIFGFDAYRSYKYSIIVGVLSVLFFYSSIPLRDNLVLFTYLYAMLCTYDERNRGLALFKLILICWVSMTLRVETGLFLLALVPLYILDGFRRKPKSGINIIVIFGGALLCLSVIGLYAKELISLFLNNNEIYLDSNKGSGLVSIFQQLPIIGNVLSVIFNFLQPMPVWIKLAPSSLYYRMEAYNIMTFPLIISAFYHWFVLVVITVGLSVGGIRKKFLDGLSFISIGHICLGIAYLYLQSFVISQRRLMAYYVLAYIISFIIMSMMKKRDLYNLLIISLYLFVGLQFIVSYIY